MTKKKRKIGGAPFVIKRPRVNHYFSATLKKKIHRKQLQLNQRTYQHKPCVYKGGKIKKDDYDEGKVEFFVRVGKDKKFKSF